jgi:tetratricopeptide (TPR) repeat protein
MFLDDVHWVDASTVELLSYISSRFESLRLLLVAAYRPSAVISAHPFLAWKLGLERVGICRELALPYLLPTDVQTYVGQYLPDHDLPPEFGAAVYERTDGSPLFMCEMMRFLVDQGIVAQDGGSWRLRCDLTALRSLIPAGVQNMIRLEIAQFTDADRRILECAAVQGVTFHSWVIGKALDLDLIETEERLGRMAAQHHFIEYGGESDERGRPVLVRFRFLHVLYQNALYADIAPNRRVALSRSVAMAMAASGDGASGSPTELALLFEQGRAYEEAAAHFLRAARRSVYAFAYPEAVLLCRRGLENLNLVAASTARDACELSFSTSLGLALMVTRGYADPEVERVHLRSRELCLRLHDQRTLVPVLWGLHTCLVNAGELLPALDLAEEMRHLALARNDPESLVQSLHALGTTLAFMGRTAEARASLEEALHVLESAGVEGRRALYILDPAVTLLSMLARVLARLGLREEAFEQARRALEIANGLEHAPSIAYATFWIGWVHHDRGEFAIACGILEAAMELSRKYGLPQFLEWARVLRGSSLTHLGRVAEGIAEMHASLDNQLAMRCMLERVFCLTLLAQALLDAGQAAEALRYCDEGLEIAGRTHAKSYEAEALALKQRALRMLSSG